MTIATLRRATLTGAIAACLGTAAVDLAGQATAAGAPSAAAPTFTRDIAPIFYANCVSCHRPGEVAPMSLLTYRDARPWAAAIRDKVSSRVMPPWGADGHFGKFRNDPSLSQRDIDTIVKDIPKILPTK